MGSIYKVDKQRFAAGDVLFSQGTEAAGLFIIKHGKVKVFKDVFTSVGTTRIDLGILGPGSLFGEMAVIDGQRRSASAEAVEATTCLVMPRNLFDDEFRQCKPWLAAIIRLLVARLRETTGMLEKQVAEVAEHGSLLLVPGAHQSEGVRAAVTELSSIIEAGQIPGLLPAKEPPRRR